MYRLGKKVVMDLYGKSHGPCVGCVLEGVPAGLTVDFGKVEKEMDLRKPHAGIGTPRKESDSPRFVSGLTDGMTDGSPLEIIIDNDNTRSTDYSEFLTRPRPGHADLPAITRFPDHDIRGGGQFSGRLTAPIVAAGSIAKQYLETKGVSVAAFSRSIGNIIDTEERDFDSALMSRGFRTRAVTEELDARINERILSVAEENDSIGGVVECITIGLPLGFGGIWFEALDSEIAGAVFSIPAVKGIEFGKGFEITKMKGSQSNDAFCMDDGIKTRTNNMGGILGGMSSGMPMVFRVAFKPTPSIGKEQDTVNLDTKNNDKLTIKGRHDPCIVPRAVSVVEAVTALVIMDQMLR